MSAIQRLLRGVWQGTKLVRMKILLYILAVCMVGVMVPTVLAESKIPTILILDPVMSPLIQQVASSQMMEHQVLAEAWSLQVVRSVGC